MAALPILRYPDRRLRMPCHEVEAFDDELRMLAEDLIDTMRAAPGIGITAAHVGRPIRLTVIELSPDEGVFVAVNPRIVWSSTATKVHPEGSVSMPGVVEDVERPADVRASWRTLDGTEHEGAFDGLMAVCIQHEIDQLDGIFWLDRLSRLRRERSEKRFAKAIRRAS
jgi:peptide deformylase